MRDDKWLFQKLDEVWDNHFPDIPQDNDVRIVWGRRARTRMGSIKQVASSMQHVASSKHPETIITINGFFRDEEIPEYVITATIAHELAHYAHGFHSPLEQKYQTPHAGGVVHNEMKERGLGDILRKQKRWLRANWREYVAKRMPQTRMPKRRLVIRWF